MIFEAIIFFSPLSVICHNYSALYGAKNCCLKKVPNCQKVLIAKKLEKQIYRKNITNKVTQILEMSFQISPKFLRIQ